MALAHNLAAGVTLSLNHKAASEWHLVVCYQEFLSDVLVKKDTILYLRLAIYFSSPIISMHSPTAIKKCIFMTFAREEAHWRAILGKANVIGTKDADLTFLDLFSQWRSSKPANDGDDSLFGNGHLDEAYKMLKAELANATRSSIVLIDDLAHLEWVGINEQDIVRFLRSIRSLLREAGASLLIIYHKLAIETPTSDVQRYLLSTCLAHIECRPLVSGRSGSVAGEIRFHIGPEAWPGDMSTPTRQVLHYRCTDITGVVFEKGSTSILT